jgi:hypothetical protein
MNAEPSRVTFTIQRFNTLVYTLRPVAGENMGCLERTNLLSMCIVLGIKYIKLHFKQNRYAFRHHMHDVTTRVTLFRILSNSQAILMLNPIFTIVYSKIKV